MAIDIHELTISQFHHLLQNNLTTCTDLVNAYLSQISRYNTALKAVVAINPNALEIARQKDLETIEILKQNNVNSSSSANARFLFPPLHGIPVILKDTYSTTDLPTTLGVKALETLQTTSDAFVVQKFRDAGAIILGKANLHEFSLQGLTLSSLGGQTLNPYDFARTPGGSSGGTAAALAANMCLVGCGGDTMNSLRSPASACSVVGFRPTRGMVSRTGIVGVSETQDAVGPMARTVGDVRVLFDVMRGEDGGDLVTVNPLRERQRQRQGRAQLQPLRIGVLRDYFEDKTTSESEIVKRTIMDALDKIRTAGPAATTELIHIPMTKALNWDPSLLIAEADTQSYEFRTILNTFLQSSLIKHTLHATLESIAASNEYDRSAMTNVFFNALQPEKFSLESPDYHLRLEKIERLKDSVGKCFEEYALDILVYPHQRRLVVEVGESEQKGRNGILAALTGRPAICIPGKIYLRKIWV